MLVLLNICGDAMDYRKFKNTEEISTIGIGSAHMHELTEEAIMELFDYAEAQGVNLVDLAMSYPEPMAHIAKALKGRRSKFKLQLHLGLTFPEGQYKRTRVLEDVRTAFEKQLKVLETDYIDYGFIHYVDNDHDYDELFTSGVFEYAKQLKKEGKIKYLGIASHMANICLKCIETGDVDLVMFSINAAYDLDPVNQLAYDGLDMKGHDQIYASKERIKLYQECMKRGIGIQVMKAFGGGTLLQGNLSPFGQAMTIYQCLQYALDRPAVLSCPLGVKSKAELESALTYYQASAEERDYSFVSKLQHKDMKGTCVYCNHCLPCPVGIDIAAVHKYLDLYLAGDDLAKEHYLDLDKNANDCIECGSCEKSCPFQVSIIDKMRRAKALMK